MSSDDDDDWGNSDSDNGSGSGFSSSDEDDGPSWPLLDYAPKKHPTKSTEDDRYWVCSCGKDGAQAESVWSCKCENANEEPDGTKCPICGFFHEEGAEEVNLFLQNTFDEAEDCFFKSNRMEDKLQSLKKKEEDLKADIQYEEENGNAIAETLKEELKQVQESIEAQITEIAETYERTQELYQTCISCEEAHRKEDPEMIEKSFAGKCRSQIVLVKLENKNFEAAKVDFDGILATDFVRDRADFRDFTDKVWKKLKNLAAEKQCDIAIMDEFFLKTIEVANKADQLLKFSYEISRLEIFNDLHCYNKCTEDVLDALYVYGENRSDQTKDLLRLYQLDLQMSERKNNMERLQSNYQRAVRLLQNSIAVDPNLSYKLQCIGGRMYLLLNKWSLAANEYTAAAEAITDVEATDGIKCLAFVMFANMISESVYPHVTIGKPRPSGAYFDQIAVGREIELHRQLSCAASSVLLRMIKDLRRSYENCDIDSFANGYKDLIKSLGPMESVNERDIEILNDIQEKVMHALLEKKLPFIVRSGERISIDYIAEQIKLDSRAAELILAQMIREGKLDGRIDQINNEYISGSRGSNSANRLYGELMTCVSTLETLHGIMAGNIESEREHFLPPRMSIFGW